MDAPYGQSHSNTADVVAPNGESAVSCRTTAFLFEALDEHGVDPAHVMEGVSAPIATLIDPACRIAWADFAKLLSNAGRYWKATEIEQFGWRFLRREWPDRHSALAALMTPADAYHWAVTDGRRRALSCVEHFAHEVDPRRVYMTSVLEAGCEPSPEFFLVLKGMFTALPAMLGLEPAQVEMEATPLSARFDISVPRAGRLARLLRPLTYPLRARARTQDLRRAVRVIDTTQRRFVRETETRRGAEMALRRSETRLKRAQQIAHVGSWEWTVGSEVTHWSDEHFAIFGQSGEDWVPTHQKFLERIHPEDREKFWKAAVGALRGDGPIEMDFRILRPDGSERVIHGRGEIEFTAAGEPLRMVGTSHDVTENRRIAGELEDYHEHLEQIVAQRTDELERSREGLHRAQRLASLGTLAAGVAHQINNPVAAILASAQYALVAQDQQDRDEIWKHALDAHATEAMRCGRIVRSLLRFARNDRGERWEDDLNEVVLRAQRALEGLASERSSRIIIDCAGDPMTAVMSPIEMEQVFVNIILNALQSREMGVTVAISTRAEGSTLVARVCDDGPGIDPDDLTQVFDPFYTGRLNEGGTGLGLSVAHGVVQDHGGTIRAESRRGEGSTLIVTLPCAPLSRTASS